MARFIPHAQLGGAARGSRGRGDGRARGLEPGGGGQRESEDNRKREQRGELNHGRVRIRANPVAVSRKRHEFARGASAPASIDGQRRTRTDNLQPVTLRL